jgi:hypothetical protein
MDNIHYALEVHSDWNYRYHYINSKVNNYIQTVLRLYVLPLGIKDSYYCFNSILLKNFFFYKFCNVVFTYY